MFKSFRCFALIIYPLMITCFYHYCFFHELFVRLVWLAQKLHSRWSNCDWFLLLFLDDVTIAVDFFCRVPHWFLMFASCLDGFLVLGPLHLTNTIWDSWSFLSAPQAILFPQRMLCNLLIQLLISGLVLHMLFQIFNFDVVFDSVA